MRFQESIWCDAKKGEATIMDKSQTSRSQSPEGFNRFSSNLLDLLSKEQIHQYNIIEMEIFEMTNSLKSSVNGFNNTQLSSVLITLKNTLQELSRLCLSLRISFISDLFQKISSFLIILVSLHLNRDDMLNGNKSTQVPEEYIQVQLMKEKEKKKEKEKIQENKKNKERVTDSAELKKLKMGGVCLYNENYLRKMERKNAMNDMFDEMERKEFWNQMENQCRATMADNIDQTFPIRDHVLPTNIFQSNSFQSGFQSIDSKNRKNSINIEDQSDTFSLNAYFTLNGTQKLTSELGSEQFSNIDLEKGLKDVEKAYTQQKKLTLSSIKNLIHKFCILYHEKYKKLEQQKQKARVQNQEEIELDEIGIQTDPCIINQKLKFQCKQLKIQLKTKLNLLDGLRQLIVQQSNCINSLEKINQDLRKKITVIGLKHTDLHDDSKKSVEIQVLRDQLRRLDPLMKSNVKIPHNTQESPPKTELSQTLSIFLNQVGKGNGPPKRMVSARKNTTRMDSIKQKTKRTPNQISHIKKLNIMPTIFSVEISMPVSQAPLEQQNKPTNYDKIEKMCANCKKTMIASFKSIQSKKQIEVQVQSIHIDSMNELQQEQKQKNKENILKKSTTPKKKNGKNKLAATEEKRSLQRTSKLLLTKYNKFRSLNKDISIYEEPTPESKLKIEPSVIKLTKNNNSSNKISIKNNNCNDESDFEQYNTAKYLNDMFNTPDNNQDWRLRRLESSLENVRTHIKLGATTKKVRFSEHQVKRTAVKPKISNEEFFGSIQAKENRKTKKLPHHMSIHLNKNEEGDSRDPSPIRQMRKTVANSFTADRSARQKERQRLKEQKKLKYRIVMNPKTVVLCFDSEALDF